MNHLLPIAHTVNRNRRNPEGRGMVWRVVVVLVGMVFFSNAAWGQIMAWELNGQTGSQTSNSSTTTVTGLTTGTLSRGTGITAATGSGTMNSTGWTSNSSLDVNDYYQFTVPVASGYSAAITAIVIALDRSSQTGDGGADIGALRSSLDGFTNNISGSPVTISTTVTNFTFTLNATNLTGTITFRLYGYSAENGNGWMSIGAISGNDLAVNGSVSLITPTLTVSPTSLAFGYVGSGSTSIKTYTLSGTALDGSLVTITPPTGFTVSTDGTNFYSSRTVAYTAPALNNTTIYVRFEPTGLPADYGGNVTNDDNGTAATVNVAVGGSSICKPSVPAPIASVTDASCPSSTDGAITLSNLPSPYSLTFVSGESDNVNLQGTLLNSLADFTVEGWVKLNPSGQYSLFGQDNVIEFGINSSGQLQLWVENTSPGGSINSAYPTDGAWHHIAGTGDGSIARLYIDGVEVGTFDHTNVANYGSSSFNSRIGAYVYSSTTPYYFNGQMIKVGLWNVALSQAQIASLASELHSYTSSESGLIAGYNFDEGTGTTLTRLPSGTNGTFGGSPAWTNPFTYQWTKTGNPGFSANTKNISSLSPGAYNVAVTFKSCPGSNGSWTVNSTKTASEAPESVTVSPSSVCSGDATTITLTASGGSLGTNASVQWFTSDCGTNPVGTGNPLTVLQTLTSPTTYYARYSGDCNTTDCASTTVTLNTSSTAPTSITGTSSICAGSSTTLTTSGGNLGTDAKDVWYSGGCPSEAFSQEWTTQPYSINGTTVNSNTNGILNVTSTDGDPMIHMENIGSFDASVYKYIQVRYRVITSAGGSIELYFSKTGGSDLSESQVVRENLISDNAWHTANMDMSANANWTGTITGWRYDWCTQSGENLELDFITLADRPVLGTGTSITVTPATNTTYYTGKKGACNTTACASQTVTVWPVPTFTTAGHNISCYGLSDGSIDVHVTSANHQNYTYSLNNGANYTGTLTGTYPDYQITGLTAGNFNIKIKDTNNCVSADCP